MTLAAVAFTKAMLRKQIMISTTSVGPGCSQPLMTAAAVASVTIDSPGRCSAATSSPIERLDPVLQQIEHFVDPTVSICDAFKPVVRYCGSHTRARSRSSARCRRRWRPCWMRL
jgi:3D-(3,5/4)-trihydroxycyclohexane-1,2-dione acylhydrolase (decyclizing)